MGECDARACEAFPKGYQRPCKTEVLKSAQKFGAVCIVTNAVHGWVEKSMKKWLPKLKEIPRAGVWHLRDVNAQHLASLCM